MEGVKGDFFSRKVLWQRVNSTAQTAGPSRMGGERSVKLLISSSDCMEVGEGSDER